MRDNSMRSVWSRFRTAGRGEITDRIRQEVSKRVDLACHSLGLGFHSPSIPSWQGAPTQFFFDRSSVSALVDLLRQRLPEAAGRIVESAEHIVEHRFDLLGFKDVNYGEQIDWSLDAVHKKRAPLKPWFQIQYLDFDEVGDSKATWELNRHQHLVTLAKAYRINGNERFSKELFAQWYDWVAKNPYPMGMNWASSLEVGMRCLSWLWVRSLMDGCDVVPANFGRDLLRMLEISGCHIEKYLSTYFSPNTHLLGEAVALFFAGTLCPELKSARRWKQRGWETVLRESQRQVRDDGFHFEQSTYYHVYALDFFLHAGLLAARNGVATPGSFDSTIEKMADALTVVSQAGAVPRFGDDDGGRVFDPQRNRGEDMLDPLATAAVIFERGDFKAAAGGLREETLWLLGAEGVAQYDRLAASPVGQKSMAFGDTGLYVMAGSKSTPQQLVIDCGPQGAMGAGHGHADALSVQMIIAGQPILVDAGTGGYVGEEGLRDWFRGTAAHNTLTVDGESQAIPRGPFAWASFANGETERFVVGRNFDYFSGKHSGYARLPGQPVHRRRIFSLKSRFCVIQDRVVGGGKHRVDVAWHFAPNLSRRADANPVFLTADRSLGVGVVWTQDRAWAQAANKEPLSPVYGAQVSSPALHFAREAELPLEFATVLVSLFEAHQETGRLRPRPAEGISAYNYQIGDHEHWFYFAEGKTWESHRWSTDAEFLYCQFAGEEIKRMILCYGSFADFNGVRIVKAQEKVEFCEVSSFEGEVTVVETKGTVALMGWPSDLRGVPGAEPAIRAGE